MNTKLIFITGASRSGTTLLSRILGKSDNILALNELHIFGDLVEVSKLKDSTSIDNLGKIIEKIIARQRGTVFNADVSTSDHELSKDLLSVLSKDKRTYKDGINVVMSMFSQGESVGILCEHTPRNIFYAQEILDSFPSAKIIHIVRDPRAVMVSQKNRWKRRRLGGSNIPLKEILRYAVNYHPITISKMWQEANKMAGKFNDNRRFMIVRFEDLLEKPEETVSALCSFVGVKFREVMLEIERAGSSNRDNIDTQKGVDRSVANHWKGLLSKGEIIICERMCSELMDKYGYTVIAKHGLLTSLSLIYKLLLYPFHLLGVIIVNPRRALIQAKAILS